MNRTTALLVSFLLPLVASAENARDINPFDAARDWNFTNGPEFPGASGKFELVEEIGKPAARIDFDFSDGGAYVSAGSPVEVAGSPGAISLSVKSAEPTWIFIRVGDVSGEFFQFKYKYSLPGEWQEFEAPLHAEMVECWGGDANKKFDFPVKQIWVGVSANAEVEKTGSAFFGRFQSVSN